MNPVSLPPFVADLGGQQPTSLIQVSFLIGKSVVGFQTPLAGLDMADYAEANARLKEMASKAEAEHAAKMLAAVAPGASV